MQVTEVRLNLVEERGRMKAVASVTFDKEFAVHDVKVIDGEKGLFIAFPSRRNNKEDGAFVDICHPVTQTMREKVQDAVLARYEEVLNESKE